jgi:hypothetical protein
MLELGGLIIIELLLVGLASYLSDLIEIAFGCYILDLLLLNDLLLFISLLGCN